jgi:hypothetical protein
MALFCIYMNRAFAGMNSPFADTNAQTRALKKAAPGCRLFMRLSDLEPGSASLIRLLIYRVVSRSRE